MEEEVETVRREDQPGDQPEEGREEVLEVPELGGQEEEQVAQRLKAGLEQGQEELGRDQGELELDQEEPEALQRPGRPE